MFTLFRNGKKCNTCLVEVQFRCIGLVDWADRRGDRGKVGME